MKHYAGLDVSLKEISICVIDGDGRVIARGSTPAEPEAVAHFFAGKNLSPESMVHESGPLSIWLQRGLLRLCQPAESAREPVLRAPGVRVQIIDYGAGIDPIHLPRLTERFYRADDHRSRALGGTGLGLAIVKHIINRHRGRLRVESELGKGTTFTVILPINDGL